MVIDMKNLFYQDNKTKLASSRKTKKWDYKWTNFGVSEK